MVLSIIRYKIRKLAKRLSPSSQPKLKRQFFYYTEKLQFKQDLECARAKTYQPIN